MIEALNRWVLAFDVGGTTTKVALVSDAGHLRAWSVFLTLSPGKESLRDRLVLKLKEAEAQAVSRPVGIAGSIAGFLDADGTLLYNPNLPSLEGTSLGADLRHLFALPVHLENDGNAACMGEYAFGAGQGSSRFLCLTGGTGIGVAMIVEGDLLRPSQNGLGDAGHVIVAPDGRQCTCGGRGCAEAMLSTVWLGEQYSQRMERPQSFRDLAEAAQANKPAARELLEAAGRHLGIAVASLANIFFPDRIAIAGGLSAGGAPLLQGAIAGFTGHGGTLPVSLATIVLARHASHAPLLGAAAGFFLQQLKDQHRAIFLTVSKQST